MQHPTLPEVLGFVPAWGTAESRVLTRLGDKLPPMHMRSYMQPVRDGEIVGRHSAGVQIDPGNYQGRHLEAQAVAA